MGGTVTVDGVPAQIAALTRAVVAYASNMESLDRIMPVIESICHKHVSREVTAVQYDAVGECLLHSLKTILGSAATPEILSAWGEAYRYLSHVFIVSENHIRQSLEKQAGYKGHKTMRVKKITKNEEGEAQLWLIPEDGRLPGHSVGQYVAIVVPFSGRIGVTTTTAYIESESTKELRLTVKDTGEKCNLALINATVGEEFSVSVPCGIPAAERP